MDVVSGSAGATRGRWSSRGFEVDGGRRRRRIIFEFWGCAFELFKGRGAGCEEKTPKCRRDARDPIVKTIFVMGYRTGYRTSTYYKTDYQPVMGL